MAWLLGALVAAGAGCGSSGRSNGLDGQDPTAENPVPVRVFAAASLADAFSDLAAEFEVRESGYEVELNLAGSSSLGVQILAGAPADVFATANGSVLDEVLDDLGHQTVQTVDGDRSQVFATNQMVIAVPTGNPAGITGIADFARSELFLGLCAAEVPCGSLAEQALARASITPSVDTREADVRALLTRIAERELDGGLVYRTDLAAAPDRVEAVDPTAITDVTRYPIAALNLGANPVGGRAFVDYVLSDAGQAVLDRHRFGPP